MTFILGFALAVAVLLLVRALATNTSRARAAIIIVGLYELLAGYPAPEVVTPFDDIGNLSALEKSSISKLYGLGITAGTSPTKFSPKDKTKAYQWHIFIGKLGMKLEAI